MGKAKRGMKVTHSSTGKQGVVASIFRGTIRVIFPDGTESIGRASSYHKTSPWPCAFIVIACFGSALGFTIGANLLW